MDYAQKFWIAQALWSENTFGRDSERGPIGPLKHLKKEVNEALNEIESTNGIDIDKLHNELVDCLFLVYDASRRAGLKYKDLYDLAFKKLEINKTRTWIRSDKPDEPMEHER